MLLWLQSLLSLLDVPNSDSRSVALPTVCTLKDLARSLHARIYYYQDPAVYTPKQGLSLMIVLWVKLQVCNLFSAL